MSLQTGVTEYATKTGVAEYATKTGVTEYATKTGMSPKNNVKQGTLICKNYFYSTLLHSIYIIISICISGKFYFPCIILNKQEHVFR